MPIHRRSKPLKRKQENLPERSRFLIYCEGEVTERLYFAALKRQLRIPGVQLGSAHGEPLGLVRAAIDHRDRAPKSAADQYAPYSEVWCVVDVEAPTPHGSLEKALDLADRNGISYAVSNPCFEIWLLLHARDQRGYVTTDQACSLLEAHGGCGYTRNGKSFDPVALLGSYEVARRRAQLLAETHIAESRWASRNPSASVWKLVESLCKQVDGSNQAPAR
ncbi:RloB family protein [Nonomuraea cavernae]|uniref:RloB family protein n=1 Tax=Nonomuraea cavernae TaxID=2045107 RepID=UPI00166B3679|nr:RloB family protein [Nonomuraea cavernae]